MTKKQKTSKPFSVVTKSILMKSLALEEFFFTNKDLFDLANLEPIEKVQLLDQDPTLFGKYATEMKLDSLPPYEKSMILTNRRLKSLWDLIKLSDSDIKCIGFGTYKSMLRADFNRHIKESFYRSLSNSQALEIFLLNPEWVETEIGKLPKFTLEALHTMALDYNDYSKYLQDFTGLSTDSSLWMQLIKKNKDNINLFIKYADTCMTKTDVRRVISVYPEIVLKIDIDMVNNFKLTHKEWALFLSKLMKDRVTGKVFKKWTLPDDVAEELKLGITMGSLSGSAKVTTQLKSALGKIEEAATPASSDTV